MSLGANVCGQVNIGGVTGAAVGQVALMSFTGSVAIPAALVVGPFRVTAADAITGQFCNVGSSSLSFTGLGVRIVTFG